MIQRPAKGEYADYYDVYVSKVPDGDILEILANQIVDTMTLLRGISEEKASHRYEPDKWSIKEVVGHVSDIERVFSYRALAFARCDKAPLPGIEQDDYAANANFDKRTLGDIAGEFQAVRTSSLAMFGSFDDDIVAHVGNASGFDFTVRSIAYILAGHELHHIEVLKERYL